MKNLFVVALLATGFAGFANGTNPTKEGKKAESKKEVLETRSACCSASANNNTTGTSATVTVCKDYDTNTQNGQAIAMGRACEAANTKAERVVSAD